MCAKPVIHKQFTLLISRNDIKFRPSVRPNMISNALPDGLSMRQCRRVNMYEAYLQISMYDAMHVAVVDTLENLLHTVAETNINLIQWLKQTPTSYSG